MLNPRLSTVFDLSIWSFIFYYIINTIVPYAVILLKYLPNLMNVSCTTTLGNTWTRGTSPTFGSACCIASDCVSASLNYSSKTRAPQTLDRIISMWRDENMFHVGMLNGVLKLDLPSKMVPGLQGILMFVAFRWALGYVRGGERR